MTQSQKLIQLLEKQVLPDTQDHLDYLFELVATKKADQEEIDELQHFIKDITQEIVKYKILVKNNTSSYNDIFVNSPLK